MQADRENAIPEGASAETILGGATWEELERQAAAELEAATIDRSTFLLDRDPDTGARELIRWDANDVDVTLERVVDVEPVLDWCKGRYNAGLANRFCEFRQYASLPPEALDVWARANGYHLPAGWYLRKEYHHLVVEAAHARDLSGFRTLPGEFRRRADRN